MEKTGVCLFVFLKKIIYLFLERGEGQEKEERNIDWLPLVRPLLGTWPATQACALTGTQTGDLSVCRPVLNPLSHTSQGMTVSLRCKSSIGAERLLPLQDTVESLLFKGKIEK